MLLAMVRLLALSVYHSAKLIGEAMQPGFPLSNVGFPNMLSVGEMVGRGVPPPQRKSTWAEVKSRYTVGT
jgi:hypothetical protein